MHKAITAL